MKLFQGHSSTLTKSAICIGEISSGCLPSVQNPPTYGQIAAEKPPWEDSSLGLFFSERPWGTGQDYKRPERMLQINKG